MDEEGAQRLPRGSQGKKLMLFLSAQILLVTACVVGHLHIYWKFQHLAPKEESHAPHEVHMQFGPISDIQNNRTLRFQHVSSSNLMDLDKTKTKIQVHCSGPYILYMEPCYISLDGAAHGDLQVRVSGSLTPLHTFRLRSSPKVTCERTHAVLYLQANENATLELFSAGSFKIKNITVGLNYELGSRCEF